MTKDNRLALGFAYLAVAFGLAAATNIGMDMHRSSGQPVPDYSDTADRTAVPAAPQR